MTNQEVINALNESTLKDRVKFRVGFKNRSGTKACMLAYVDARYVMDRLDYAVGKDNWSAVYSITGNTMFCTIKVIWPDGKVTKKTDCGIETDIDAEKGQASDAFKRAAVHYGIGRDLYTYPNYCANLDQSGYVDRDWKPEGWGSSSEGDLTTTTQPLTPSTPQPSKAQDIADRLAETAKNQQETGQVMPVQDLSVDDEPLKKGTPPEGEYVWINNLTKVAESAKAQLLLPPDFEGDPKDGELTKFYWMPVSKMGQVVANMNGKYNVEVERWVAEQTLDNGKPKWEIADTDAPIETDPPF